MNVLHGALCDDGPEHCAAKARMQLLARAIEAADCPEVVGLEEIAPGWRTSLFARAKTLCDGAYHVVSPPVGAFTFDAQTVLSTLPTSNVRRFDLAPRISQRRALRLTVDTPNDPMVVVVTHTGTNADDLGTAASAALRPTIARRRAIRPVLRSPVRCFSCATSRWATTTASRRSSRAT